MLHEISAEVAETYGLDAALLNGAPIGPLPWQREVYRVRAKRDAELVPFRSLRINRWLNFGNMVGQLARAVAFAGRHDVPLVTGPESAWFETGRVAGVRVRLDGAVRGPALEGRFFYGPVLGIDDEIPVEVLRDLRRRFVAAPTEPAWDLAIHIRSGDIFGDDPHPAYWPQPLSYFQAVVAQVRPARVAVVSQDERHPAIASLLAWCRDRGIAAELRSASLREDVGVLVSSRSLCLSVGTMGLAAGWLSDRVEQVFVPRAEQVGELLALGVDVWSADLPGATALGPWTGAAEQCAGLLDAPAPELRRLQPIPAAGSLKSEPTSRRRR